MGDKITIKIYHFWDRYPYISTTCPAPQDHIPQLPCTFPDMIFPVPLSMEGQRHSKSNMTLVGYFCLKMWRTLAYPQNCGKPLGDYKLWEFWGVPIFRQPHIHATRISQRPSGCLCWLWVGLEYSTSIHTECEI